MMSEIKPRLFTCRRCGATLGVKTPTRLTLSATVYTTEPTPITCNVCNMRTYWRPITPQTSFEKYTVNNDFTPPSQGD